MTFLGKLLVFLNLLLSLAFMALAVGIITHRLDWSGDGKPNEGEYNRKKNDIQQQMKNVELARLRWKGELANLQALDLRRQNNEKWYKNQLTILTTGADDAGQPANQAVKTFVFSGENLELDKEGRPALIPHPDTRFKARELLRKDLEAKGKDIDRVNKEIEMLVAEEKRLTMELNGDGNERGLRGLLDSAEGTLRVTRFGAEYVRPIRGNREVEAELLQKRNDSLKKRKAELEKVGVVRQP